MNEPKALKGAEGKNQNLANALKGQEGSAEAQAFASELELSLAVEGETKAAEQAPKGEATAVELAPIEVAAEQVLQMPSSLIKSEDNTDTASPKVFDPALTKGVEKLIQPKTSAVPLTDAQVLELANGEVQATEIKGEIAQAMLKTPNIADAANGRAPSIDFAKTEIDPQLMNMEDFVAQKNLANKKALPHAYGMKAMPESQQKMVLENGLKSTQVIQETTAVDGSPVNSQQFILNIMNEQGTPQTNETQAAPKVFDMSNIKTTNTNQIIDQITNYVVQAKTASEPTVNMRIKHDELGMIDITVSKSGVNHESIAVNIGTHTAEGKNFFQQNSKDLLTHLTSAGMNISDVKVETPTQLAKNDFDFGSQSGRNQQGSEKQFGSEQNQRRHEQERRQDLWKLLNKEAA
ncbi:MAG: flagellar hook-length control protein FliK [Bacteriovoracaceae bacterium]|nr:flagellar hook-length control protein FliK [Bacteriovoracaceae bacterium]